MRTGIWSLGMGKKCENWNGIMRFGHWEVEFGKKRLGNGIGTRLQDPLH